MALTPEKPPRKIFQGLPARKTTVILIDMQLYFISNLEYGRAKKLLAEQVKLLRECARNDIPVIVLEYFESGPTIEVLAREIEKVPRNHTFIKTGDDGFWSTDLEGTLEKYGMKTLILTGINASVCVLKTAKSAVKLGYEIVTCNALIADAVSESWGDRKKWYAYNGVFLDRRPSLAIG